MQIESPSLALLGCGVMTPFLICDTTLMGKIFRLNRAICEADEDYSHKAKRVYDL